MKTELIPITLTLPGGEPRSRGIHVSKVIRAIAVEDGILKKEWVEDLSLIEVGPSGWWESLDTVSKLRISLGLAWEEWYAGVLAEQMGVDFHPGECCVDGVYMTPDGESLDMLLSFSGLAIHEIKLTYKSLNTVGIDLQGKNWMWLAQTKAYCKAKGTTVAYLHVFFVCGDYSYPMRPMLGPDAIQPMCWRIEFTQEEIDSNWEVIIGYVRHRQQQEAEDAMRDTEEA